jgi:CheY-like chemotaxis protein
LLRRALQKAGPHPEVVAASDGGEAIRYLAGEPLYADRARHPLPGLVILDLKMPVKSGFDVLRWRLDHPDLARLPVVVLTSSALESDKEHALRLGAFGYFVRVRLIRQTQWPS